MNSPSFLAEKRRATPNKYCIMHTIQENQEKPRKNKSKKKKERKKERNADFWLIRVTALLFGWLGGE